MALTKVSYSLINGAPYNVKDYGALGNGSADDTAAINLAITAANTAGGGVVYVPQGTYMVSAISNAGIATGVSSIIMLDNVHLVIDGTIKVKNNAYGAGAFYGAIRSLDTGLSNASITGVGTINGNKANQTASVQCSNIYLTCSFNVVVDGIYSVNANGMGIQLVPVTGSTHTACAVQNCFVNNVTNIGIQVSHGLYGNISENRITTCVNNCIDIYGDDGSVSPDNGIMSINGNTVGSGLVGVFVETSKRVSVVGNAIDGCTTGVAVNRINGAPSIISISGNTVSNCATGVSNTGDTGGVLISNNFINFTGYGLVLGGTAVAVSGNVSYTNAFGNVFSPTSSTAPIIIIGGYQASFNIVRENYYTATSTALYSNVAAVNVNNTVELPKFDQVVQPIKQIFGGLSTSGGTATLTLPSDAGGKLVIKSSAGGSNYSVWSGSFVSSGAGAAVNQDSTTYVAGSNNIASVVANPANFTVTITFAATGAGGTWNAWAEYF